MRWAMDLSKVVEFVGESGDSDYEGLLSGLHRTVILQGICKEAAARIHSNRSYPLEHVLPKPTDQPDKLIQCEKCDPPAIRALLAKLGILKTT